MIMVDCCCCRRRSSSCRRCSARRCCSSCRLCSSCRRCSACLCSSCRRCSACHRSCCCRRRSSSCRRRSASCRCCSACCSCLRCMSSRVVKFPDLWFAPGWFALLSAKTGPALASTNADASIPQIILFLAIFPPCLGKRFDLPKLDIYFPIREIIKTKAPEACVSMPKAASKLL